MSFPNAAANELEAIRSDLISRALRLIRSCDSSEDTHLNGLSEGSAEAPGDTHLDSLLDDIAAFQTRRIPAYQRLCAAHAASRTTATRAPALPTDVFRYARIAAHNEANDTRVFRTSGTTQGLRGAHAFRDLTLYDAAAEVHARRMLFPDRTRLRLIMLASPPDEAPESSLSYMLGRFTDWFGEGETTWCMEDGRLDDVALVDALTDAEASGASVALLGTSFAFVFAEDALAARSFSLPEGSRVMQTGGYKGRSREVAPATLRAQISARYGVHQDHVVAEYGMTELSSQFYESTLRQRWLGHTVTPGVLVPPRWVRATPVHPETLLPVANGQEGLLRVDDAANIDSVAAILTSDVAVRVGEGVALRGRATGAGLRGCSLSVEEAMKGG